jgi:hypothetical protein
MLIIGLLKDNLSKNKYIKNRTANNINIKNDYNYLKFFFNNFFKNFKFNQSIDLKVLLKKYII